ncbi:P-loop containing nucleoside triphosphate hydrolase protein [Triangularia setosa]|uniref:P-loop containing nucleoside triphosphate hydrolase protein n=1 Tax=Triangularia setosa TaxID=2587417 RepID=A0AAN6VYS3_9PEZI|nr:P-loop containing nucleoside triphosphate hydrolase protein [Podospora setosa]
MFQGLMLRRPKVVLMHRLLEYAEEGTNSQTCEGAWAEVLPDLVKTGSSTALTSAIKAFAFSILVGEPRRNIPMAAALEAYSIALRSVNDALQVPETSSLPELMAAVMCLLFAELVLPTSLESWTAHLEGLGQLIQTREPQFYASGIAHRLFVGARPALIVLRIQSRKSCFLASEAWRTAPFREIAPSPMQALMGEAAVIPGIIERLSQGPGQDAAARMLAELEALLDRLAMWEKSFQATAESPHFWFDGNCIWFDSLTTANGLTHCWAFKVICLTSIGKIVTSVLNRRTSTQISEEFITQENRRLSVLICQSTRYLMQDKMKLFGPTSIVLPLQTAYDTLKAGGVETEKDFAWCKNSRITAAIMSDQEREHALASFKQKLIESREWETKLKNLRLEIKGLQKDFDNTEDHIKALQSVGQIIGEVLKQLDEERFIVKASSGPRYVVGCRSKVDKAKLKQGTRVALDMTTLTIMRMLPREVDPLVYNMSLEDPGQVSFGGIGGLNEQIRELREVIELPLKNPELFLRVGIKPPKGVLLYGPPGTGKTLLARAVASSLETNFLKVVASAIVDKYIGESARLIREMFGYAKEHEPCIIFMDEIDAIGGRRFSEGTSADREIQRTLMELLNQLDGFDYLGKTKIIMATNRPDTLDPALLRAGRLDRKIEIPLPNEVGRLEILKIHAAGVAKDGEIDFESVVKMSDGLNGADLRNVVTEAGLFAIKADRDAINQDDFNKAVRKVAESKKLEGKLEYQKL